MDDFSGGAIGLSNRCTPILFGACALLLMSACSSENPDALSNTNSEQSNIIDLNEAMNAIAVAPANSGDTVAPKPAAEPTVPANDRSSPTSKVTHEVGRQRVQPEPLNAVLEPDSDEENPSSPPSEEPTNDSASEDD